MTNFKYIQLTFVLILIVLLFFRVSFEWFGALFFVFLMITVIGSFSMSWNFHIKAFTSNKTVKKKVIAITFDDGPNPEYTPRVLELLSEYNSKATFFCIGNQIEQHPDLLKSISDLGHDIGNHSYSHDPMIDFKKKNEWIKEILQTDVLIQKVTGFNSKLFRPPFGVTTPHLSNAIKETGHNVIGWNIRSYDTAIGNPLIIQKRIIKRVKPGAIILLHDKHKHIRSVLEHLLQFLKEQDYKMVTITELMDEN